MIKKNFSTFLGLALAVGIFGFITAASVVAQTAAPATSSQIDNVVPAFTSHTAESWTQAYISSEASTDARNSSSTTYPTNIGTDVVFTATADDPNDDEYYLIVCTTDAVTEGQSDPWVPSCDVTEICTSDSTTDETAATCSKTTTGAAETVNWYSFVCDNNPDPLCSDASNTSQGLAVDEANGTPTLHGSPYHQNHRPTWATKTITDTGNASIQPGETLKFITGVVTDGDDNTSSDTVSLYICAGESDMPASGAVSGGFDDQSLNCMNSGTTLCSLTAQADGTTLTCNDGSNIVSIPTAHASNYTVEYYVIDSHGFMATTTADQDFTVTDVAPILTIGDTYEEDASISIGVNSYDDVVIDVNLTDDNGDNDIETINEFMFYEDGTVNEGCSDDENDCYLLSAIMPFTLSGIGTSAPATEVEGCFTVAGTKGRSTAGSGKLAQGTDENLEVTCHFVVRFNALPSTSWTAEARISDGTTSNIDLANSSTMTIAAATGLGVVESSINYSTVALSAESGNIPTTIQNLHNTVIDVLVDGTNMSLGTWAGNEASCAADVDCIARVQQKWEQGSSVTYASAAILQTDATGGTTTPKCINNDLAIRANYAPDLCQNGTTSCTVATQVADCPSDVCDTNTDDEVTSWKIKIPAEQASGAYTGANTFTSTTGCN